MGYIFILVLVALAYVTYLLIKSALDFTPPEGFHHEIREKGQEFEKVVLVGPDRRVVSKSYTSVYGLKGAARQTVKKAREIWRIEGQTPEQYAKVLGQKGKK